MARVKKKKESIYILYPVFLLVLSLFSIIEDVVSIIIILMIASMFLFVRIMPKCKYYENLWMFFLTAVASLPINVKIPLLILSEHFYNQRPVFKILTITLLFIFLLSVEEVSIGVITRIFWRNQYKIKTQQKNISRRISK